MRVGPFCVVGPRVRLGPGHGARVARGDRRRHPVGERNRFFPFSSIGLVPQDLKFRGEPARVEIGDRNTFREGTTVHRGTAGGGGAHAHRLGQPLHGPGPRGPRLPGGEPHDLRERRGASPATSRSRTTRPSAAYSAVHQFCRVGVHAFMGGATVATKDVLPFSLTVGNRAHLYGANVVGLRRRGFTAGGDRRAAAAPSARCSRPGTTPVARPSSSCAAAGPLTPEVRDARRLRARRPKRGVVLARRRGARPAADEARGLSTACRGSRSASSRATAASRSSPPPGARRAGRRVVALAIREEAAPELEARGRRDPLGLPRPARQGDRGPAARGRARGGDGGAGQAPADLLGHRARPEADGPPRAPRLPEHRQPHRRRGRRARARGHHAPAVDRLPRRPAGAAGAR